MRRILGLAAVFFALSQNFYSLSADPADDSNPTVSTPQSLLPLVPDELNSLILPEELLRTSLHIVEHQEFADKNLPGTTALWVDSKTGTQLFAGIHRLNPDALRHLSHNDFLEELEKTSKLYETYYKEKPEVKTACRIKSRKNFFRLRITSRYSEDGKTRREVRVMYFYRPDYRLNFLFYGTDDAVRELEKTLRENFSNFEESLRNKFSKPLGLRKDRP